MSRQAQQGCDKESDVNTSTDDSKAVVSLEQRLKAVAGSIPVSASVDRGRIALCDFNSVAL